MASKHSSCSEMTAIATGDDLRSCLADSKEMGKERWHGFSGEKCFMASPMAIWQQQQASPEAEWCPQRAYGCSPYTPQFQTLYVQPLLCTHNTCMSSAGTCVYTVVHWPTTLQPSPDAADTSTYQWAQHHLLPIPTLHSTMHTRHSPKIQMSILKIIST